MYTTPLKMIFPLLMSRMKQFRNSTSFGIDSRQVWTLVKITVNASQGQVVEVVAATKYPWDNVLHVKCGQRRIFLAQLAILAAISRACARSAGLILYDLVPIIWRACR